ATSTRVAHFIGLFPSSLEGVRGSGRTMTIRKLPAQVSPKRSISTHRYDGSDGRPNRTPGSAPEGVGAGRQSCTRRSRGKGGQGQTSRCYSTDDPHVLCHTEPVSPSPTPPTVITVTWRRPNKLYSTSMYLILGVTITCVVAKPSGRWLL